MVDKNKLDALKTLQGVINRLQRNSFANKGWMVGLITTIVTVSYSQDILLHSSSAILYTLLIFFFWLCDANYQGLSMHYRSVMNEEATKLSDENYKYITMLGNIKGIGKREQLKATFRYFFDASVFPFYFVVWFALMMFLFLGESPKCVNPKTVPVDSVFVDKRVMELKSYMHDSVAAKIDMSVKLTTGLSEYIHDSLNVSRRIKAKHNHDACLRYILINTCNDTVMHKADLHDSESITNF